SVQGDELQVASRVPQRTTRVFRSRSVTTATACPGRPRETCGGAVRITTGGVESRVTETWSSSVRPEASVATATRGCVRSSRGTVALNVQVPGLVREVAAGTPLTATVTVPA